ncbi:hypothetical protein FXV77_13390 [Sphingobacterium phlebotomi]|uniref:Uncharacterized protein n=1 Tax=Sphingobacterium phlebotomi TaxID=2605433 RepID=A0A5D4H514_9SPHI|nr:hypothetical protein [Sphingobacterium phlebotomi]TYR35382.1 hypothetical protein FXV77_13390 [Sphingobacterium phlebotomi]
MKGKKKFWIIAVGLILLLGYGIWEAYNQPSIKDLPGDFEEVAFVRNEQNKGGIMRVYAVSVGDMANAQYDACADMFPTNDYGSITKIYFFDKSNPYPTSLTIDPPHYDTNLYEAVMILKRTGSAETP